MKYTQWATQVSSQSAVHPSVTYENLSRALISLRCTNTIKHIIRWPAQVEWPRQRVEKNTRLLFGLLAPELRYLLLRAINTKLWQCNTTYIYWSPVRGKNATTSHNFNFVLKSLQWSIIPHKQTNLILILESISWDKESGLSMSW